MSAWAKQRSDQIKKLGSKKAPWYCFWYEPDGTARKKSCGIGTRGKQSAERKAAKIRAALLENRYEKNELCTWAEFCDRYFDDKKVRTKVGSMIEIRRSMKHVERILKPKTVQSLNAERITKFVAVRAGERGQKPKSKVSPSTINKDLRNLKAALNTAAEWGIIPSCPKIRMLKEPKKLPTYVNESDFLAIYNAAAVATKPTEFPHGCQAWWRGLFVTAFMTGWRIGELLSLKWADVDLEAGTAVTRARDNKGGRDEIVRLHPLVVEHIREIRCFHPNVFAWEHHRRTLDVEFAKIQDAAGIRLRCPDAGDANHGDCTAACRRYSFHDERRAFATHNAPNMTREALQSLMRHQSSMTTDRYINMARQLDPAVVKLHVPNLAAIETA